MISTYPEVIHQFLVELLLNVRMSCDQISAVGQRISCGLETTEKEDPSVGNDLVIGEQMMKRPALRIRLRFAVLVQTIFRRRHQKLKDVVVVGSRTFDAILSALIDDTLDLVDDRLGKLAARRSYAENNGQYLTDDWEING